MLKTMITSLLKNWKRNETEAEGRWRKRVSARALGGKIKDFKIWLGTDTGQMALVGTFVVCCILVGIIDHM
jgi:hypothetical protein